MPDSTRLTALKQNPLWDFALDFYTRPGVERACLCLQDGLQDDLQDEAKVDVCELLLHAWLFYHGLEADPVAIAHERRVRERWQQEITGVLRQLRRELKGAAQESDGVAELRVTIKKAELLAERENLQRWQQWALSAQECSLPDLKEMTQRPQHSEDWLHLQLFSPNFRFSEKTGNVGELSPRDALAIVGSQLDRFTRAR